MNTFGNSITLTTFGESHGPAMGGVLDGFPPRVSIDLEEVQRELDRRAPGRQANTSARKEPDKVEILSGMHPDGYTLGTSIGFIIRNQDARSKDYSKYGDKFRPNHADYTYYQKYGVTPLPGGGRTSARETVNWVVGGAFCKQWLAKFGISFHAEFIETNNVAETAKHGDSTGGIVSCVIKGVPAGLGEPIFGKLHSRLAAAMMGINAAKAFEYGDGIRSASMLGTEMADIYRPTDARGMKDPFRAEPCETNHSGGIQGGISNGMDINFKVYFKPTPTVMQPQRTIDVNGNECETSPAGRHDPCVAMRAVPVVEAMAALVIADAMKTARGFSTE